MKNFLICSFLGATLLYVLLHNSGSRHSEEKKPFLPYNPKIVLNPLDAIRGEKQLDDGSLRKDNFDSILRIRASFLKDSSVLYTIQQLTKNVFLLTRKKFYYDNRCYSLFVKTSGDSIIAYHRVIDFSIRSAVYSDQRIYTISDDYDEIPSPWPPTYMVKVTCFDLNFREQWNTTSIPNKRYLFYGTKLELKNNNLFAGIVVQREGSSTMCTKSYILKLKISGEIVPETTEYLGGYGCGPDLVKSELPLLFRYEKLPLQQSF